MSTTFQEALAEVEALVARGEFVAAEPRVRALADHRPPDGAEVDAFAGFYERWADATPAEHPQVELRLRTIARHAAWQYAAMAPGSTEGRARMRRVHRLDVRIAALRAQLTPPATSPSAPRSP